VDSELWMSRLWAHAPTEVTAFGEKSILERSPDQFFAMGKMPPYELVARNLLREQ